MLMKGASLPSPVYHLNPKRRWSVNLHLMSGITLWPWLKVLYTHWRRIDWRLYFHRVLVLSFMSICNTLLSFWDWLWYRHQVASQALHPEPVFVLGHPRTGTTHLHNLLSLDPRFAFATTFTVGFPSTFLGLDRYKGWLSPLLTKTRPMDNMHLDWDTPGPEAGRQEKFRKHLVDVWQEASGELQEDEIAVNCLSGGMSPYLALAFMRDEKACFRRLYTFQNAAPSEYAAWERAFLWFVRKVTFAAGRSSQSTDPRPMLLKSPVHTARMAVWMRLFPRARFLYIHRHPLQVARSSFHMADSYYWYTYLQQPSDADVTTYVLEQYELMYDAYIEGRERLPAGSLHELSFDELEADPMTCLRRLYDDLGWTEHFDAVRPAFQRYCQSLSDFKKNQLSELSPELEAEVRRRWSPSFERWGYQ